MKRTPLAFALALSILLVAQQVAAQLVVSQVYGGGGNAGATYKNDFIEIFNAGSSTASLSGWSVQYASAAGSSWQRTNLSGSIAAGQYYLVQEAAGSGGTTNLPTPDATGTIAMSGTAGKVALVSNQTLLTGTCPGSALGVVDFVGFGTTANCYEGAGPTATLSNTTAAIRAGAGCTDTNNNGADFATGAPTPRNTASPTNVCSSGPTPLAIGTVSPLPAATVLQPYSQTFAASGGSGSGYVFLQTAGTLPPGLTLTGATLAGSPTDDSGSPYTFTIQVTDSAEATATKDFTLTVNPIPPCTVTQTIAAIQGNGTASPFAGSIVTTSGIVTGRKSNGFFIQMPAAGDSDATTSDGVFVYGSAPAAAAVGNSVCVTGTVQEYVPSADPNSPSTTEVGLPTSVFALSTDNSLPSPVVLTAADTDPAGALLFLQRYEGMRVQVNSLTVTGPTRGNLSEANATSTSNGVFNGVITGIARPFREAGVQLPDPLPAGSPCCVPHWDANPEVLAVNSLGQTGGTALDVASGAVVSGLVGPLEYASRSFTIDLDPAPAPGVANNTLTFTPAPAATSAELTIASFNMERFYDTANDPSVSDVVLTATAYANRLNKASLAIRNVLRTPDVLGVEEMGNLATLQAVAAKVNADAVTAGDPDPNYQAYLDLGNDVGGINVGFLVKASRVTVVDVTQVGSTATYVDPVSGNPATLNDRPPLVLRATVTRSGSDQALPFTVIVNHLRSLSGIDDPTDGPRVRAKREAQAEFLAGLIQTRQTADPTENIVSVGDYNAYEVNDGYADVMGVVRGTPVPTDQVVEPPATITSPALTDLLAGAPADQRYSYTYSGTAQVLDHVLVNPNMMGRLARFAYARNGADFPEVFRNDPNRPERLSDHDMPVAYFTLPLNHTPAAVAQSQGTAVNTPTTFVLNASDPDAGDTVALATTAPPANGSVTYDDATRQATYTPTAGFTGADSFTYSITDQGGLTASATVTLAVNPLAAIAATGGTPQAAPVNVQFAQPLQATVTDTAGNPALGVTVTFTAPASGPSGTFPGHALTVTASTDASGVATSPVFTANGTVGSYTVTASAAGVAGTATFAFENLEVVEIPALGTAGLALLALLLAGLGALFLARARG
ncbi:MAG: lamin tail domain-containing protein [Thermoanaerobaculaceae bacterium]|nr:lamin tail domain-containing protein [Thermoanaerobaculaceae bacterium]